MREEKRKAPRLRFPGFDGDWEQRKVGELVKTHNAGIYISKEKYGKGTNVVGVGNIYDNDIFDGEIYRLGPVNDDKYLLDEGDLVYGESSLVLEGIARTVSVGKNGAGSAFAWHTRRVKLDKEIVDSHFATLELNYHPIVRKHLMGVATQTALTGMTTEGYFSAPLFLPSIEEQRRICSIFRYIDNITSLHQHKLNQIKEYKKGMLQKMFPKKGETVPEVRFPGFEGDWEQRKLSDLAAVSTGYPFDSKDFSDDGEYLVITNGNIQNESAIVNNKVGNHISITDEKIVSSYLLDIGDILVTMDGTVGRTAKVAEKGQILAQRVGRVKAAKNEEFLYQWLNTGSFSKAMLELSHGGTIKHISLEEIRSFEAAVPVLLEEQVLIGCFFRDLDNFITLHEHKLDEMKEYKKGLLQQMFV